jgi:hypothetical protein
MPGPDQGGPGPGFRRPDFPNQFVINERPSFMLDEANSIVAKFMTKWATAAATGALNAPPPPPPLQHNLSPRPLLRHPRRLPHQRLLRRLPT